jgi:hypothetical protein
LVWKRRAHGTVSDLFGLMMLASYGSVNMIACSNVEGNYF